MAADSRSGRAAAARRRTHEDDAPASAQPQKRPSAKSDRAARPENLDELIHQRTRLAILTALTTHERLAFNDLKALLDITDGNLSVHARKLEDVGYVRCTKRFRGRTPLTEYALTATGRRALEHYLDHMESIITAARDAT